MIVKVIDPPKPENDHYRRLARYIADADHAGEKALVSWCAGCWAGEDYDLAIHEVEATQAMNSRTEKAKTYHLVVSFRPEDEERLKPEDFLAMEKRFAAALGFADHQRHCGVHKNTHHLHLHVAYNMIRREELTRNEPYKKHMALHEAARELEKEYGLIVDPGMEIKLPPHEKLSQAAGRMEAHSGQQSFEGYVKERHDAIMEASGQAADWRELHLAMAAYGLEFALRGAGLVIKDRHDKKDKRAVKASALDRMCSLAKLEKRFGAFAPAADLPKEAERERYSADPRQKERENLKREFEAGLETRTEKLRLIKEAEDAELLRIQRKWEAAREDLQKEYLAGNLSKRSLIKLIQHSRLNEREDRDTIRRRGREPRLEVKKEHPFASWNDFLKMKAEQGDELALETLRYWENKERYLVAKGDKAPEAEKPDYEALAKRRAEIWEAAKEREKAVLSADGLRDTSRRALLAVLKMDRLEEEEKAFGKPGEAPLFAGMKHSIDNRGVILFTLRGGGLIRDTGKEIYFSAFDAAAKEAAQKYAAARWGKRVVLEGNQIRFAPENILEPERLEKVQEKERGKGLGR